jgi:hypothetical protein
MFLSRTERTFLLIVLISIAILAGGCAGTPVPYGQVFIGHRLGNSGGFESCSSENGGWRVGVEVPVTERLSWAPEYEHVSHALCGRPFNDKPEDYLDHIGLTITYRLIPHD